MKPTKLMMILCAAAQLAAAQIVCAQDSPTPTPTVAPMLPPFTKPNLGDVLNRMLLLTTAQKAQLQPFVDAVQPQLDAIHQQSRQAEDGLLKELDGSIRLWLTPEQQTKLDVFEVMRVGGTRPNPGEAGLMFGKNFGGASQ
jgi:Spy/CpxP family protein refolding chaperone